MTIDPEPDILRPPDPVLTPYWTQGDQTIYHADCRILLPQMKALEVPIGCVVTAPPFRGGLYCWQVAAACWKAEQTDPVQFAKYESDLMWAADKRRWFMSWLPYLHGFLEPQGLLWLMLPPYLVMVAGTVLTLLEWPVRLTVLKPYEALVGIGHRGLATPVADQVTRAFLAAPCQAEEPTTSLALIEVLLAASHGVPGAVLDPFLGDGGVLVAARARGLTGIGIEIDQRRCDKAVAALEAR